MTETDGSTTQSVGSIINTIKGASLENLIYALIVLVIGLVAVRLVIKGFHRLLTRTKLPETLHKLIVTLVRILLDIVVILSAAGKVGIPITSFVALLSLVGLAASLAVQGLLTNAAGGIILAVNKPFKDGDYIEHDSISGTVSEISMLNTRLLSPDGKTIYIPNGQLYTSRLINYTSHGLRRVDISLSASYDASPEKVRAAILPAAISTPNVLNDPAPQVLVEKYADSAIEYTLRAWCKSGDFMQVKYDLTEMLYGAFAKAGVEMTYPHMNVHIK
ncbi:MAG: mechanosensitive ion channel family protein [Clostridia bacterium]|nr:mechanosensitive ion channel family protein [Clostridia bacterium]